MTDNIFPLNANILDQLLQENRVNLKTISIRELGILINDFEKKSE